LAKGPKNNRGLVTGSSDCSNTTGNMLSDREVGSEGTGMKIYTKTGDQGETGLLGAARVSKSNLRIEALGTIDEFNAAIGVLRAQLSVAGSDGGEMGETPPADSSAPLDPESRFDSGEVDSQLLLVQKALFEIGAAVADVRAVPTKLELAGRIEVLEKKMDDWANLLPPLTSFILPAGTFGASYSHLCRCVCRRAERRVVELIEAESRLQTVTNVDLGFQNLASSQIYLNRLSDWLFMLARYLNHCFGVRDEPWPGER